MCARFHFELELGLELRLTLGFKLGLELGLELGRNHAFVCGSNSLAIAHRTLTTPLLYPYCTLIVPLLNPYLLLYNINRRRQFVQSLEH